MPDISVVLHFFCLNKWWNFLLDSQQEFNMEYITFLSLFCLNLDFLGGNLQKTLQKNTKDFLLALHSRITPGRD